jgi:IS5 family transposase
MKRSKMRFTSVQAMRTFAGIDLSVEAVPDATTEEAEGNSGGRWTGEPLLHFRHLLEAHDLPAQIFAEVGALLSERKLLMREGTIVDATFHRRALLDQERAQGA